MPPVRCGIQEKFSLRPQQNHITPRPLHHRTFIAPVRARSSSQTQTQIGNQRAFLHLNLLTPPPPQAVAGNLTCAPPRTPRPTLSVPSHPHTNFPHCTGLTVRGPPHPSKKGVSCTRDTVPGGRPSTASFLVRRGCPVFWTLFQVGIPLLFTAR